jgi:DNA-nicking Smr family endonuclease
MSGDADKPGRRSRRGLTSGERELWSSVTRSIAPLRRVRPRPPEPDVAESEPPAAGAPLTPAPASRPPIQPREKPALAPLDRRLRQRLARGREAIDATIDLHGLTQGQAHAALTHFLRRASAGRARLVLVITGKGGSADDFSDRGVLRRQVPHWLTSSELRDYVIGFDAAHVAHGGEGALYVRVRRRRGDQDDTAGTR